MKRGFFVDYVHLDWFEALVKAWQYGLILAHNIVLLNEEGVLKVCVVEYGYLDFKEGFISLWDLFQNSGI